MNKKAIVLSETLKIIVAVICIVLLFSLMSKVYSVYKDKTAVEQAEQTLNSLVNKINSLEDGQADSYMVVAPIGWTIRYYLRGEGICNEDVCLCICPEESKESKCKGGICKKANYQVGFGLAKLSFFKIKGMTEIFFSRIGDKILASSIGGEEKINKQTKLNEFLQSKANFDNQEKTISYLIYKIALKSQNDPEVMKLKNPLFSSTNNIEITEDYEEKKIIEEKAKDFFDKEYGIERWYLEIRLFETERYNYLIFINKPTDFNNFVQVFEKLGGDITVRLKVKKNE